MIATEILEAQMELLDRLDYNERFRHFAGINAHAATNLGSANGFADGDPKDLGIDQAIANIRPGVDELESMFPRGYHWVRALRNYTEAAYAYRVTPDMCVLLEHAANGLDEDDLCDPQLAPTGCGIVRFEKAIRVSDIQGKEMLVHWLVWGPATHTVNGEEHASLALSFFNDLWTDPDDSAKGLAKYLEEEEFPEVMESIGRWMPTHFTMYTESLSLGPTMLMPGNEQQMRFLLNGHDAPPMAGTNLFRYVHALFLMLNQTLVRVEDDQPNRASRRRAMRKGMPGKVAVIALRRQEGVSRHEGESVVEWSHRWVVRGHWRWQACGPGRAERKRIWIAPFVKGPEDKELIITDKLYELRR